VLSSRTEVTSKKAGSATAVAVPAFLRCADIFEFQYLIISPLNLADKFLPHLSIATVVLLLQD